MEKLTYGSLKKLCVEKRNRGELPKGTKCTGSRETLEKLLFAPKSRPPRPREPLEESEGPYDYVYRYLAPYLTLDKLLLLLAYYPQGPLAEEVKDPHGKIWSDRVWVELGEPPVFIGEQGPRYYHLYTTRILSPWSKLVVRGKNETVEVDLTVKQAHFDLMKNIEVEHEPNATINSKVIYVLCWALTKQGFQHAFFRLGKNYHMSQVKEGLEDMKNWRSLGDPGEEFIYIVSTKHNMALALNRQGVVSYFKAIYSRKDGFKIKKISRKILTGVPPLRDLRFASFVEDQNYMGIALNGEHVFFSQVGHILKPATSATRTYIEYDQINDFEEYSVKGSDPNLHWTLMHPNNIERVRNEGMPGMIPDKIYVLPLTGTLLIKGSNLFRAMDPGTGYFVDIRGRVNWVRYAYKKSGIFEHEITTYNYPYRFFSYGRYSSWWYGLAW